MNDSPDVPALRTERLLLRGFVLNDLDALAAIFADPEVMRFIRCGARTYAQTKEHLACYIREWDTRGYGVWAVTARDDSNEIAMPDARGGLGGPALLGICGFVARAELGYILSRAAWGRGLATEAARACLRFGFDTLGFDEIGAGALASNIGSRHVIEKLGFRRCPDPYFDGNGGVYYRRQRESGAPEPARHTDDGAATRGAPR